MASRPNCSVRGSGKGEVEVRDFGQSSSKIAILSSAYPLRLISPRLAPSSRAVIVFILTYGGGLVAGDETHLRVQVIGNARLGLVTQGFTKVYKTTSGDICNTIQTLTATIRDQGALLLLPDPVQPFADSVYEQRQIFDMDPNRSSLLLLDWVSEGRSARGESWKLSHFRGSNEIWSFPEFVDGADDVESMGRRLLLRDNIKLDCGNSKSGELLQERMQGLGVFGTLIIAGPLFQTLANFFLERYSSRPRKGEKNWSMKSSRDSYEQHHTDTLEQNFDPSLTWTATSTRKFVIVRFGAKAVEHARRWLKEMLTQDGTVEREFGNRYLFCLQDR